ncbi:MAG: DUF2063 domain-containing protein [Sphingomonas hengshuiensis]|nr:MAG: DUF2063 domain-containing protein [Sphingomonas hengshuiensis]
MADFATFQRDFAAAIYGAGDGCPAARLPGFAVYRNTSLKGAVDALCANYAVVARLLGAESFSAIAAEYVRAHPPAAPMLALFGDGFAAFIAASPLHDALPYLADVARVERWWTESLFAADAEPVEAAAIAAQGEAAIMTMPLALHPAVRFAWLETPAAAIWVAHQGDEVDDLEIDWAPQGLLISRIDGMVTLDIIEQPGFALVEAIAGGVPLGEAAVQVLSAHPGADIAAIFAQLLARGALVHP